MATNVELDDRLIEEAQQLGHHRSKRATIEEALREYVQHRKQMEIKDLFGQIDYEKSFDYKALRKRK
jgi:Arc/MetJ family transcription regulator